MTDNINGTEAHSILTSAEQKPIELTLSLLVSSLGITASAEFIDDVRKCLVAENTMPDEQIVRLFEAIYSSAVSFADNVVINKVFADDKEIVRTLSDLYKKYEYLSKETPLTLSGITEIAAEYLSSIDVLPIRPSQDDSAGKMIISAKDGNRLFSAAFDKKKTLPYGYINQEKAENKELVSDGTLIILIEGDYTSLCTEPLFGECRISSAEIDSRGLLYAILSLACGALIDTSELVELKDLVLSYHGEHIVAVAPEKVGEMLALAQGNGLSANVIATATATPSVRFNYLCDTVNLRSGFLRRLFAYKKGFVAECASEAFVPTEYIPLISSIGALEDTVSYNGHIIAAKCAKQCSFVNGINTVLDSVFSLLSKGVDRRRISISLNVSANAQNASSALAAILGAYRVVMELCLPIGSSKISFSDNEHIFCAAYAEDECNNVCRESFSSDNLYLLSFKRFSNTSPELMPDFEEIRKMCDFLYSSISSKTFSTVYPINGSALSAANTICPTGYDLVPIADDGISESTYAQGFIVRTKPDIILNAPRIGFLRQKTDTEQNTEE